MKRGRINRRGSGAKEILKDLRKHKRKEVMKKEKNARRKNEGYKKGII